MSNGTWMSNPNIQSMALSDIVLPGTHDSGSWQLFPIPAQIQYGDTEILLQLNEGSAPATGSNPFRKGSAIYIGPELYNFVMNTLASCSLTQAMSIAGQMMIGIRYFDMRVYFDTNLQKFCVQHGLVGHGFSYILDYIEKTIVWMGENAAELFIVNISHTCISDEQTINELSALIDKYVGQYTFVPTDFQPGQLYDINNLAQVSLAQITGGSCKIMFICTDQLIGSVDNIVFTNGYNNSGRPVSGTNRVDYLSFYELQGLQQATNVKGTFYQLSWTLTAQPLDIISGFINALSSLTPQAPLIQSFAADAYSALNGFAELYSPANKNLSYNFNLITVDWAGANDSTTTVVDLAIQLTNANALRGDRPEDKGDGGG